MTNKSPLLELIDKAFDYRGDVTIHLHNGVPVIGYIFNRCSDVTNPHLEMFLAGSSNSLRIGYQDIRDIEFTGTDHASSNRFQSGKAHSVRRIEQNGAD